jgi:hypothetical protein
MSQRRRSLRLARPPATCEQEFGPFFSTVLPSVSAELLRCGVNIPLALDYITQENQPNQRFPRTFCIVALRDNGYVPDPAWTALNEATPPLGPFTPVLGLFYFEKYANYNGPNHLIYVAFVPNSKYRMRFEELRDPKKALMRCLEEWPKLYIIWNKIRSFVSFDDTPENRSLSRLLQSSVGAQGTLATLRYGSRTNLFNIILLKQSGPPLLSIVNRPVDPNGSFQWDALFSDFYETYQDLPTLPVQFHELLPREINFSDIYVVGTFGGYMRPTFVGTISQFLMQNFSLYYTRECPVYTPYDISIISREFTLYKFDETDSMNFPRGPPSLASSRSSRSGVSIGSSSRHSSPRSVQSYSGPGDTSNIRTWQQFVDYLQAMADSQPPRVVASNAADVISFNDLVPTDIVVDFDNSVQRFNQFVTLDTMREFYRAQGENEQIPVVKSIRSGTHRGELLILSPANRSYYPATRIMAFHPDPSGPPIQGGRKRGSHTSTVTKKHRSNRPC